MIRRKLTRIELQLDDTKELDELFNKTTVIPQQTLNKQFQNFLTFDKQSQSETNIESQINATADGPQGQLTNTTSSGGDAQERIAYNPQPHNSGTRFQFNQSFIR
jgi:hypothetical protein